jgi:heptosyltransferase-3
MSKTLEKYIKKIIIFFITIIFPARLRPAIQGDWTSFKRILIFRLDNRLGNSILILSLVQAIKRSAPKIQIDVLMTSRFLEIYQHHPDIHELIPYDQYYLLRRPWRYLVLWRNLRRQDYDVVFSSSNPNTLSISQGIMSRLITRKHAVGFDWQQSNRIYTDVVKGNVHIHYAFSQIDLWRYFNPLAGYERPRLYLAVNDCVPANKLLFWLGATGRKKIPADLILKIVAVFSELQIQFTLAAGPDDAQLIRYLPLPIRQQVLVSSGTLKDTATFFKSYKVICMPDTGPMHLAAALDIPLIQVFINSNSTWYAYQGEHFLLIDKNLNAAVLKNFLHKYFPVHV